MGETTLCDFDTWNIKNGGDERTTMNFMLSQRIFLLLQAQSHANSLAGAYPRGYGALIELIKK